MTSYLGFELNDEVREPVADPTLGIEVELPPVEGEFAHRLVTIGDSLTHGFQHFALFNTSKSWPAMLAERLGIGLRYPVVHGPGGHPLNLEWVAREFDGSELVSGRHIYKLMGQVERYYEVGDGSAEPDRTAPINENLAIWGWDLRDCIERTADTELAAIAAPKRNRLVGSSGARAAVGVLNSARDEADRALTPLQAAQHLGAERGGIETLCVWLGANNVLGSVVDLRLVLSADDGYRDLEKKQHYTVWQPSHFRRELLEVVDEVRSTGARHVLWATVPHVTIPPITRGLGGHLDECKRYFRYYGRPWQNDHTFKPNADRHLTGFEAWLIDTIIDAYNEMIVDQVRLARQAGLDWLVVDTCAALDRVAFRRNEVDPPPWLATYPDPRPAALNDLDTRFFVTDEVGDRLQGGLIGLDGIHPTTSCYAVIANKFLEVMADAADVEFPAGSMATRVPLGSPGTEPVARPAIDFAAARHADTLVSAPPSYIGNTLDFIRWVDDHVNLIQRLLPGKLPF